MASFSTKTTISIMFLCITLALMLIHGNSTEFMVGDSKGWNVPSSKEPNTYNQWAEKKRFKVNDTLEFEYKKDSVMEVSESEYEKCRPTAPLYFSNSGHSVVELNRSGLFYFISGVTGHCERGQKMVVKVLDIVAPPSDQQPPPPTDQGSGDKKKKNGATHLKFMGVSSMMLAIVGFVLMA
ncbi:early nodulin-like protein 5 [Silene latifolia]|uniref:early nodulin-like protein 5 n=1 Tax=Silene latifolia TaxID=37657 RepID=UPI003D7748FD